MFFLGGDAILRDMFVALLFVMEMVVCPAGIIGMEEDGGILVSGGVDVRFILAFFGPLFFGC